MALGYITVNVITADVDKQLPKLLREQGYGVTDWSANGLEGDRSGMQILTPRKYELKLYIRLLKKWIRKHLLFHMNQKRYMADFG